MVHAIVRLGDGLADRAWLRSVVRNIQSGLAESGFDIGEDGKFGRYTGTMLGEFQKQRGVTVTGVTDSETWEQIEPAVIAALDRRQPHLAEQLPKFRGDIHWVHYQEGHKGQPYWPGGESGVTLDPGVDLGHASRDLVGRVYRSLLEDLQYDAVMRVCGIKGDEADQALRAEEDLQSIRLTFDHAERILPFAAGDYWKDVCERFHVDREATPPGVQTALLSLAYNRGAGNPNLKVLNAPLAAEQWAAVANLVGAMQQSHTSPGVPLRRRAEANLIVAELKYLATLDRSPRSPADP